MPELRPPTTAVHRSFLGWVAEASAEDPPAGGTRSFPRELRYWGEHWHEPAVFARYVRQLRESTRPESWGSDQPWLPRTTLWWIGGERMEVFLGSLVITHRLDQWQHDQGGHIGYVVRPSARRQGHATAMLRAALPHARQLGLDQALVTCDAENTASRKVIEACGGVFEDQRGSKLRYWIATGGESSRTG